MTASTARTVKGPLRRKILWMRWSKNSQSTSTIPAQESKVFPTQQALDHEDHCGYYEAETAGLQGGQHRRIEGAAEEGQESDSTE